MSQRGLTVLAVDDERTQLSDLARMLRASSSVHDVQCAPDGREALAKASDGRYDAIFLDVRMPDLDGLELGRVLRCFVAPPVLVFVSAYDTPAVDAFELHALDYLRKPVSRRRLDQTLERVLLATGEPGRQLGSETDHLRSGGDRNRVAVANVLGGGTTLLACSSILYAQAHGDYARIVSGEGRYLLRAPLSELEQRWQPLGFVRVHRQYLANLRRAVELRPLLGGTAEISFGQGYAVPIARRHLAGIRRHLRM